MIQFYLSLRVLQPARFYEFIVAPSNFYAILGMKVNLSNCSLTSVNIEEPVPYASLIGCEVDFLPITNLSFPLGGYPSFFFLWDLVVEQVDRTFDCWNQL